MRDISTLKRQSKEGRAPGLKRSSYATLGGGLLVGVPAAFIGAVFWAICSEFTGMQLAGLVALVVGFLTGSGVRSGGKGTTADFGVLGAVLTLAGCAFGQMLAQVGVNAHADGVAYLTELRISSIARLFSETSSEFGPLTAITYMAGACVGYWRAVI